MPTKRRLTPEDVLSFKNVEDAQISPDGSQVAFVVGDSFKTDSKWAKSSIWIVETAGGTPLQLTNGPRTDSLPRWSPDGKQLAFVSDRLEDGQRQVFVLNPHGGEASALTDVTGAIPSPRGLNALQWSPDGSSLAFLKEDTESDDEKRKKEEKDDAIEFEQNPKYVRLWTVDAQSREVKCVSPDDIQIWEFAWHPNSREIAAVVSDAPYEWAWYTNRLVRFEFDGPATTVWQSRRQVALPVWSPNGSHIAFVSSNWSDRGCVAGDIWLVDAAGGEARDISQGIVASIGWLDWSDDSSELLTISQERGGVGMHRIDVASGEHTSVWWQQAAVCEAHWPRFSRSDDGTIVVALEDAGHPRDVWVGCEESDSIAWRQLTDLHPQATEIEIGQTEVHHWKGADDWDMQGLVIKPVGYEAGRSYPMVMWVHGGPTGVSGSCYYAATMWNQLLAEAGFVVFLPNYRGSTGWGLEFAESNLGDMGGKDFQDMMLGIDSLVESGLADPERLAVAGWSYGGFTTAWAVSQTDRFRAAVMGAGIAHWLSFHGMSSLSDWDGIHYQASPYDLDGPFQKFSPLTYCENLNTPTLILHGEQDEDVPAEQSYLFYRALKNKGVDTQLVIYPREAHGVAEQAHMLDMSRRVLDWIGRYLLDHE
jgi:dipeptidyl aminopeptidase/acylaminoacyl peptidase